MTGLRERSYGVQSANNAVEAAVAVLSTPVDATGGFLYRSGVVPVVTVIPHRTGSVGDPSPHEGGGVTDGAANLDGHHTGGIAVAEEIHAGSAFWVVFTQVLGDPDGVATATEALRSR